MAHKRRQSDSEDEFSDYERDSCGVSRSEDALPAGGSTRKKRRGIIEKKRRDRINVSLGELRRLVPAALEKSGSTKLEKAEILQMTVDHLKTMHSKGEYADTTRVAIDYHIIGFRECAAEVARYLVSVEGMDVQDPIRLRLMSHLQMFSAQKDVSARPSYPYPASYPCPGNAMDQGKVQHDQRGHHADFTDLSGPSFSRGGGSSGHSHIQSLPGMGQMSSHLQPAYANYTSFTSLTIPPPGSSYPPPPHGKPYRPWGAEMAY